MQITLQSLVNRLNIDESMLKKYPKNKEVLERHIKETKALIVKCVLQNNENPLLEQIILK